MPLTDAQREADAASRQRRAEALAAGLPGEAIQAYRAHLNNAKRRGIPMLFTIHEWWAWWQEDGRWEKRGRGPDALCMARYGDTGPYSPENVYPETQGENVRTALKRNPPSGAHLVAHTLRMAAEGKLYLQTVGDNHPKARPVITPKGRFPSASAAAKAYGITRAGASYRAKSGKDGWSYEAECVPPDVAP